MSKYIKYENLDFRINNDIFYSTSVQLSLRSNISPVILSDGSLLRYAPESTVIGTLSTEFYLTGAMQSYLIPCADSESPVSASFAGVSIDNCYLKNMSFSVSDFNSISLNVEFDWYGQINTNNSTNNIRPFLTSRNSSLSAISHANHSYIIDLNKAFGFDEIFSFSYSEQCDRVPFFENGKIIPFRVAKTNKQKTVSVDGNFFKQNNILNIDGNISSCDLYLKDFDNNLLNQFNISGRIDSRSMNVGNDGILQSNLSITQRIAPLRNTL